MNGEGDGEIRVYRPNQRHELGLLHTWVVMVRNVYRARELIWQLFKRDFFAGYKKSFIGFTWIFIAPIMGIVSWVFLRQTNILQPGDVGVPFTVYVLIGSSVWGLFMGFYGGARSTLSSGRSLVMQVNYPHEALLFKQAAGRLANFSLTFVVLIVVLLAFKQPLRWTILLFPLVALPLFFLGSAVGLVLSMVSIVAVDVSRIVNRGMALLMFVTPIVYAENALKIENPFFRELVSRLIRINPLTYLVCSARDIIIYGRLYDNWGFAICSAISVVAFMISWRLFFVSEHQVIEKMI